MLSPLTLEFVPTFSQLQLQPFRPQETRRTSSQERQCLPTQSLGRLPKETLLTLILVDCLKLFPGKVKVNFKILQKWIHFISHFASYLDFIEFLSMFHSTSVYEGVWRNVRRAFGLIGGAWV